MSGDISVSTAKLRSSLRIDRLIRGSALVGRLMRRGSELAGFHIAQVAESAQTIAGGIFLPARDRQIAPAAKAAAGRCHRDVIATVGEKMYFRHRRLGRGEDPVIRGRFR